MFVFALASGAAVAAAPWLARRNRWYGLAALALGAVPFAVATWSTLVTPLIAALAVTAGLTVMRSPAPEAER